MTRLSLRSLLTGTDEATLRECLQRWCDDTEVKPRRSAITRAATAMEDEALVLRRIAALRRGIRARADLRQALPRVESGPAPPPFEN